MDKPRSSRLRRLVAAVGGGVLLVAGLAAASAPAGSPREAPDDAYPLNGHIDVVVPESTTPADSEYTAEGETGPVGAPGDAEGTRSPSATPPTARSAAVTGTDEEGAPAVYDIERPG